MIKGSATIAAIIPTYRRWDALIDTLNDLCKQSRVPDEIIVIDQTPAEEIPRQRWSEFLEIVDKSRRVKYFRQEIPRVYQARNLAWRESGSDILLYLDDDIQCPSDLVERHLHRHQEPEIDAVVGMTLDPGIVPENRFPTGRDRNPFELSFRFVPNHTKLESNISYICAGHFSVKSDVLTSVGGWDQNIITYGDKEMGLRLFKAGYNIVYDPEICLLHLRLPLGGTRISDARAPWSAADRSQSINYLAMKHLEGVPGIMRYGLFRSARHTFLLKRNVLKPSKLPGEFIGWVRGAIRAYNLSRSQAGIQRLDNVGSSERMTPDGLDT